MLDSFKITTRLLTEAQYLAFHDGCAWHSSDAVANVVEIANIEISGKEWTKTHNAVEVNLTDPGVTTCNIHNLWLHDMRLINANDHGDGIRIKGSATPPGPVVNVYDIQYDRLNAGFLPLFCGEGYLKELNIWQAAQNPGTDGAWPQQWIGSVSSPLLRVYTTTARTCVQCDSGTLKAINVDNTAIPGRFSVNAGPAPVVVPWAPPTSPTPPPVNPVPGQMGDVTKLIVMRGVNPAIERISDANGKTVLTIDGFTYRFQ